MKKALVLNRVERLVRRKFEKEGTGHDWWHIHRVRNSALSIGKKEGGNLFIIELGALLHDIADHKFHGGDTSVGSRTAVSLLKKANADKETIASVQHIVEHVSFSKSAGIKNSMKSLEGKIVQDADRLDALGAIGIARAFAYGGYKKRLLYDPSKKERRYRSAKEYRKKDAASTIHHFYEKLLILKNKMNTKTGKRLARERHVFLEKFLKQFFAEWDGKNRHYN